MSEIIRRVKKIRYQTVVDKFIKYNCELLLDENEFNLLDPNEKTVFKYKTSCNHEREMAYKSFMNGNGSLCVTCTKNCFTDKHREKRGLTFDQVKQIVENKGCKLLVNNDEEFKDMYKNNRSNIKYIAICGHSNEICYLSFSNDLGLMCKTCTQIQSSQQSAQKQRTPYHEVKKYFEDNECVLLYDEIEFNKIYKNVITKLKYIAKCGHEYETSYTIFKDGKSRECNKCTKISTGKKITQIQINKSNYNYKNNILNDGKTKLNFNDVKKKYTDNGCELLIKTNDEFNNIYKNSESILPYKCQCDHNSEMSYKSFCAGDGLFCKQCTKINTAIKLNKIQKLDYQTVKKRFDDKQCKLLLTEVNFDEIYINSSSSLSYIATCGHNCQTDYNHFNSYDDSGLLCKYCLNKKVSEDLKNRYSGENRLKTTKIEYEAIKYLIEILKNNFQCIKADDGCKADIIIKPLNILTDEYIGLQIKSTENKNKRNSYNFKIANKSYENMAIICICVNDEKIWCFENEHIKDLNILTVSQTSKYNKFELNKLNIDEYILGIYNKLKKNSFDILNKASNLKTQQEQFYKQHRINMIDFLDFNQSDMEGTVYDFLIDDIKFQEKVGTLADNEIDNVYYLSKKCGKNKSQCYEEGDNDFYWLNNKDFNSFYIIPESVLIEKNIVGRIDKIPVKFRISKNANLWTNAYEFSYLDIDKPRLIKLIFNNNKQIVNNILDV